MLKPLTSFRFFAALAVFLSHLSYFKEYDYLSWVYIRIFSEGSIGVSFFFILSGFILTYNYHNKFKELNIYNTTKFFVSRIARIYPVHILTFMLSLPLLYKAFMENTIISLAKTIPNLMLIQSFFPKREIYFSFNGVSWSLSNEMFFYICLPFIIYFFTKIKINGFKSLVLLVILYILAAIIVITCRDVSIKGWLFYIFPLFRMTEFMIGSFIALFFINHPVKEDLDKYKGYFTFFEIFSLLILAIGICMVQYVPTEFRYGIYYIPFMSQIIYIFAYQKGGISKLLSCKLFIYLGEISFSFYMLHQLVIRYSSYLPGINSSPIILAIFSLSISLVGSKFIYSYYEVPMRNKIKKGYPLIFSTREKFKKQKIAQ